MFGTYIGKIMLLLQYIEAQRQIEAQSTGFKTTPYLSSFVRGSCNVNFMLLAEPRSENWICQYGRPSFVKWLICGVTLSSYWSGLWAVRDTNFCVLNRAY